MSLSLKPTLTLQQPAKNDSDTDRMLIKQGRCAKCSIYTHERRGFRLVALTNKQVYKGRCLACNPMKGDSSLVIPEGTTEDQDESAGRSSFPWLLCFILSLLVVAGAAIGIYFGVVAQSEDSEDAVTTVVDTSPFEFRWEFSENGKGILFAEASHWIDTEKESLDSCMDYCADQDALAGNYFEEIGVVPGWPDSNCFCAPNILCFADFTQEEKDLWAPKGWTFSNVDKADENTCEGTYCDFQPSLRLCEPSSTEPPVEESTPASTPEKKTEAPNNNNNDSLYLFVWEHGDDAVISSTDWTASYQATIDDCMAICDSLGKTSGNFFAEAGAVEGWQYDNCFCTSAIYCFVEVLTNEVARIKEGSAFTNVNKSEYTTCDESYCLSWPDMCS